MKKLISSIVLGVILATGFFSAVNTQADDLAWGERFPPIFMPTNVDTTI